MKNQGPVRHPPVCIQISVILCATLQYTYRSLPCVPPCNIHTDFYHPICRPPVYIQISTILYTTLQYTDRSLSCCTPLSSIHTDLCHRITLQLIENTLQEPDWLPGLERLGTVTPLPLALDHHHIYCYCYGCSLPLKTFLLQSVY